jgi:CheY-like chemotaxis protein
MEQLATAEPAGEPVAVATGPQTTVLVVDDDSVVRALTQQMLEESGFNVVSAADGRQALELFRGTSDRIDVVLLDMTMPHMDGEATFRELRRVRDDVPVVVSSGYSEQDAMTRFSEARPDGYLQKPYRMGELLEAVRRAGAGD